MGKEDGDDNDGDGSNDGFWDESSFVEAMSSEEAERKRRTIHMRHDEEMNFRCKKCDAKISAHNNDWHGGMCDSCFDRMFDGK